MNSLYDQLNELIQNATYGENDMAYFVNYKWFYRLKKSFLEKTNFNSPLKNDILLCNGKINPTLINGRDYIVVPKKAWNLLLQHYDQVVEIPCPVLFDKKAGKFQPCIDPKVINVYYQDRPIEIIANKQDTIQSILDAACEIFDISPHNVKLHDFWNLDRGQHFSPDTVLSDITKATILDLELFGETVYAREEVNGKVGFKNLGNTCYMNSILQCITHLPEIINKFSNLEKKSRISQEFSELLYNVWHGHSPVIEPIDIKRAIGASQSQFAGNQQQDAHEFLITFLDILHEELKESNLISKKGKGSKIKIDVSPSPIKDIFYSTIEACKVCPNCSESTPDYQPHPIVSVPIAKNFIQVVYIPYNLESKPRVLFISKSEVPTEDDLFIAIASRVGAALFVFTVDGKTPSAISIDRFIIALELPMDSSERKYKIASLPDSNKLPILLPFYDVDENIERLDRYYGADNWDVDDNEDVFVESEACSDCYANPFIVKVEDIDKVGDDYHVYPKKGAVTVDACLQFLADNALVEESATWECPSCKEKVSPRLRNRFDSLPPVLVIQLERFVQVSTTIVKDKTKVEIPMELDMSPYLCEDTSTSLVKYRLVSICEHLGMYGFGHYTAACKVDGKWMRFSDQMFHGINEDMLQTENAYILFYEAVQ